MAWKIRGEVRTVSLISVLDKELETVIRSTVVDAWGNMIWTGKITCLFERKVMSFQPRDKKNQFSRIIWYSPLKLPESPY